MAQARPTRRPRRRTIDGNLGADNSAGIFSSAGAEGWGAKFFEWTHPQQVASEYEAVGKAPPPATTATDVFNAAYDQATVTAQSAGENFSTGFDLLKKALVIGAILYGVHLALELTKEVKR